MRRDVVANFFDEIWVTNSKEAFLDHAAYEVWLPKALEIALTEVTIQNLVNAILQLGETSLELTYYTLRRIEWLSYEQKELLKKNFLLHTDPWFARLWLTFIWGVFSEGEKRELCDILVTTLDSENTLHHHYAYYSLRDDIKFTSEQRQTLKTIVCSTKEYHLATLAFQQINDFSQEELKGLIAIFWVVGAKSILLYSLNISQKKKQMLEVFVDENTKKSVTS